MSTNRAREVAAGPELASPQLLLHLGATPEDLPCRRALDDRHQPAPAVGGHRLHEKMHMVLVRADLQELQLVADLERQADLPDLSLRSVVNGLEFGCGLRRLRGTRICRVPTGWVVPG